MQLPSTGIAMPTKTYMHRQGVTPSGSIYVVVTPEIIEKSTPEDSSKCMIAQAIRLQRGGSSVRVTTDNVAFNWNGTRYSYTMPAAVAAHLIDFDRRKTTRPFAFLLEGRTMTTRPITKGKKRGPYKAKASKGSKVKVTRKAKAKHCKRRFKGVRMVEVHGRQVAAQF